VSVRDRAADPENCRQIAELLSKSGNLPTVSLFFQAQA